MIREEQLTKINHAASQVDIMVASLSIAYGLTECLLSEWAIKLAVTQHQEALNNALRQKALGNHFCPNSCKPYDEIIVRSKGLLEQKDLVSHMLELLKSIANLLKANQSLQMSMALYSANGFFPIKFYISGGSFICDQLNKPFNLVQLRILLSEVMNEIICDRAVFMPSDNAQKVLAVRVYLHRLEIHLDTITSSMPITSLTPTLLLLFDCIAPSPLETTMISLRQKWKQQLKKENKFL
ncbi:hypothetical protein WH47_09782 [Habropoda laboriosa]|uniref:Uncharacterized protein n=1 Tax=Habropoda laboriosa TaxID=597456 RepID=A0A0L7QIT3_9HYME|nr:hypothetical protein WH47_09782 [Habropoda laboriosa]